MNLKYIKGDLYGGITAAVVAIPLALAFGVSSGAGAMAGLYGAIFVGLFAALFGGTPTQISGPTGPMTVVMAGIFTQFSASDINSGPIIAFTVVILSGVIQVILGILRVGKYIKLVPIPVISGFMSGIGMIIILLQLGPLLGHEVQSSPQDVIF
ncbi:MAG: SulP family inorganic anion transporter, partial [Gammaproteobacteria bacterium]